MSRSLYIPLHNGTEQVAVPLDALPDASEFIQLLRDERCSIRTWLKCASAYNRQGKFEAYRQLLTGLQTERGEQLNRESKADRLAVLNALASMYTQLARKEKDNKKREEYYNQATQHYNQADRIDVHEEQTWIGKGVTYLARGQTERAEFQFETVLQQNARNIAAQLGKASVQMEKKNFHQALASYSAVVEQLGSVGQGQYASHDEVEAHRHVFTTALLGLGEAYWRLNHAERARACFERASQLDDSLALPLVYRALLDLNIAARHDAQDKHVRNRYVVSAIQLFKRAYDLHSQNSVVLNHLSSHLFSKRDYDKARTLALQAYHQTNQKKIQAEACYNIGRTYHAEDNLDQAFKYYTQAIQLWPDYVLALYTLAQLYIARNELDKATDLLDKATKHPQCDTTEVIKLLAELCAAREDETRALNLLKHVTSQSESRDAADFVLWLARAQLTQRHDPQDALVAYQRARDLLGLDKDDSSALTNQTLAVLNNCAVLKHMLHDDEGAERDLKRALGDEEQWMTPARVTLAYNLARLWEDEHDTRRALDLYKRILKDHPAYLEGYFRIGLMARARGDILEAGEWFKDPMSVQPNDLGAWTLWANMNLDKGELNTAQKKFERVLAVDKNEPYANVQLATVYATAAHQTTVSDSTSETRRDKHLKNALDFYHRALKQDPSNIYAAVGVAIVFAERKEYATAIDLFNRIREQITAANKQNKTQWDIEEPHINLAHCYMHTKQHEKAVLLYELCSSKFHNSKDTTRLLYLAHAYFKNEQYEHCFRTLNKALFLGPQLLDSWYGMAVCLKEFGGRTLTQLPRGNVSQGALLAAIAEVRQAIKSLDVAAPIFERLHSMKDERSKRMFSTTKCALYERICSNNVEQLKERLNELEKKLTDAEQSAKERQEKARQFMEQKLRTEEEKARVEEERRAHEEELAQKALEESRQLKEQYKRLQEQEEQLNNLAEEDEGRRKRGKKKKRTEDDEEEIVYDNSAPEYAEPSEPLTAEQQEGRRLSALDEIKKKRGAKRPRDSEEEEISGERKKKKKQKSKDKKDKKEKRREKKRKRREEGAEEGEEEQRKEKRRRIRKQTDEESKESDLELDLSNEISSVSGDRAEMRDVEEEKKEVDADQDNDNNNDNVNDNANAHVNGDNNEGAHDEAPVQEDTNMHEETTD